MSVYGPLISLIEFGSIAIINLDDKQGSSDGNRKQQGNTKVSAIKINAGTQSKPKQKYFFSHSKAV